MRNRRDHNEHDDYSEHDDEPAFTPMKRQSDKTQSIHDQRRQQGKEWGKAHFKWAKEKRRAGGNRKP